MAEDEAAIRKSKLAIAAASNVEKMDSLPTTICRQISVLESLILEFFHGVSYDLSIPCIDCVQIGSQDPHMFSLKNIKRAIDLKVAFLQCWTNFHIVPIEALINLLPPSSTADYERHITSMLHELKQLSTSSNVIGHILVLCHFLDSHSSRKNAVTAKRICASFATRNITASYLEIAGKQSQVDLGSKLTSCQVIVAVISEQFCKDKACADTFSFVKRSVKRPLICVVITADDQKWRYTTVGAIVSTEIYVNFSSNDRYDDKMEELLQRIQSKVQLSLVKKKVEEQFDVFISYCWLNSKDAVSKGIEKTAGSLGEVDPREFYDFLEKNRIRAWLDVKCTREGAIFEEIADALRMSKMVLVCVSDEYIKSKNCLMEFHFAVATLKRPFVLCVVGTGQQWRTSEVVMLSLTSPRIDFQTRNQSYFDVLLKTIGESLSANEKCAKQNTKPLEKVKSSSKSQDKIGKKAKKRHISEEGKDSKKRSSNSQKKTRAHSVDPRMPSTAKKQYENEKTFVDSSNLNSHTEADAQLANNQSAYEELCELAQRKFLRQCSQVAIECRNSGWQSFPHLVFLDSINFKNSVNGHTQTALSANGSSTFTATRMPRGSMRGVGVIFEKVGLTKDTACIRFLCEYDEGWHINGASYALPTDSAFEEILDASCAYLAALYSILQYSPVAVNIFEDKEKGADFITSLKRYSKDNVTTEFKESFFALNKQAHRATVQGKVLNGPVMETPGETSGSGQSLGHGLRWYHTHSRKKLWLCEHHSKFTRGLVDADYVIPRANQQQQRPTPTYSAISEKPVSTLT